jgi:hypothetical protein
MGRHAFHIGWIIMLTSANPPLSHSPENRPLVLLAWVLMLLVSDLPNIFWNTFFGREPEWLSWAKVALLAVFLALCLIWKRTRALWRFSFMILVLYLAFRVSAWVGDSSWWRSQFGGPQVSFTVGHLGIQLRDWGVTLVIIAALWMIKRRRDEFFLARGQLDAPVEPVRWLGIGKGASWATFGWIFSLCISLGTLMFVVIAGRPSPEMLVQLIPLLPAVLLIAAMNAFSEEMSYRASLHHGGNVRAGALSIRHTEWGDRFLNDWICGVAVGEKHAGDERPFLGVVDPLPAGCDDLRVCRDQIGLGDEDPRTGVGESFMEDRSAKERENRPSSHMPMAAAIGTALGAGVGAAFLSVLGAWTIAAGAGVGVALGAGVGAMLDIQRKRHR